MLEGNQPLKATLMNCPHCQSSQAYPTQQSTQLGYRIFRCRACRQRFNERTGTVFNYVQFPTDVVLLVVLWRPRYKLSLRDLAEMFLMRGFTFTHETVRDWETRFAPLLSNQLKRRRRGQAGKSWYVDGCWQYLYRAIDRDGNLVDIRLSATRDLEASQAFFEQALATVGHKPERVTTDKHAAYPQAIQATLGFTVIHRTNPYLNNRIERDH